VRSQSACDAARWAAERTAKDAPLRPGRRPAAGSLHRSEVNLCRSLKQYLSYAGTREARLCRPGLRCPAGSLCHRSRGTLHAPLLNVAQQRRALYAAPYVERVTAALQSNKCLPNALYRPPCLDLLAKSNANAHHGYLCLAVNCTVVKDCPFLVSKPETGRKLAPSGVE
jgi:hypothetical protein